jgi:OmcA/MtrC family decaheme c-type cytochrome
MGRKAIWATMVVVGLLLAIGVSDQGLRTVSGAGMSTSTPPETCTVCHKDAGEKHQVSYDALYQDGVIKVSNMAYSFAAPNRTVITFKITKNGAAFNANDADSLAIQFVPYTGNGFEGAGRVSLKGTITCDANGNCTNTLVGNVPNVGNTAGLIALYGTDEIVGELPARIRLGKFPFAAILETGSGVDYESAANNAGCEKCHTTPYLKHGYIYAQVNGDPSNDFYTCKACHLDNGKGGHFEWQLLVDNPALAADFLAGKVKLTPEQEAQYAYKTSLMNDVHMSHSMEFPYPQSMANCVTCHEGKLDQVLSDANFTIETCKSCHPMTGAKASAAAGAQPAWDTTGLALQNIIPQAIHGSMDLNATNCALCHGEGKAASSFSQIHSGYDDVIYTAEGQRYSDAVKVSVDAASLSGNKLTIKFSAVENTDLAGIDVSKISPTVLVGLYGWDTKDYLVGPHERLTDDNGDGAINSSDARALEYVVGSKNPRFTTVSAADGKWEVTADLSPWANMIGLGNKVMRAEIAVMPALKNAAGDMVALDAPSRTFNLIMNSFADGWFPPIVKEVEGCNKCHDALATTFHSPDRSGNVVVCRLCHTTTSGGGHLEMQSRSIDSYVHAIHSFQAFDVGTINFADPVQKTEYAHHTETTYPAHGITNCESCHVEGKYNVPDQTRSLPGILSASSAVKGWDRAIGSVPSYITGPASRACGGCHRAVSINEDKPGELIPFLHHTDMGGYLIEAGSNARGNLMQVMNEVTALFQ